MQRVFFCVNVDTANTNGLGITHFETLFPENESSKRP